MPSLAEKVAHIALAKFDSLPGKCKPRSLPDGRKEWTPMSAVVLAQIGGDQNLTCVSLATGTKCLPASALPRCKGLVLHDCHAEVLALRGFNYWLLAEVQQTLRNPSYRSPYLDINTVGEASDRPEPPFMIRDDISIHFFTTEAPCGDASMELLMESFISNDAAPWPVDDSTSVTLQGRGHFSLLGYVRRKPARADAEASLSKSCTDKLAVKQFSSILSFPTDLFIRKTPSAYIQALVVCADQYHTIGYGRAFGRSGRLSSLSNLGHFFQVEALPVDFPRFAFAKQQQSSSTLPVSKPKVSNISTLWISRTASKEMDIVEVLINGVKQGYKQWDEKVSKASVVSRKQLQHLATSIGGLLGQEHSGRYFEAVTKRRTVYWLKCVHDALSASTYEEAKSSQLRTSSRDLRKNVTDALGNWTRATLDSDWGYGPS